jgi:hypothetical protein
MKKIQTLVLFLLVLTQGLAQNNKLQYSNWLFVQSDKALQYRIAIVKQVGDVASLQLQFRVNNQDEVFCKSPLCDGILLSLRNTEVGATTNSNYSFIFKKSFIGLENIYTWPQLLTTELKTWPDGSKRFLSLTKGIVYSNSGSTVENNADVPDCCVDIVLGANPNQHRCDRHGFNNEKAIIVK